MVQVVSFVENRCTSGIGQLYEGRFGLSCFAAGSLLASKMARRA